MFEYRVNVTDPLGDAAAANVAVSPTVIAAPVTAVDGLANVVSVGDALATTICSFASVQPVVKPLLFVSPA